MKLRKSSHDYEASNVVIEADTITKPEKIVLTNSHHGVESLADGDVSVKVRHQYPRSEGDSFRPSAGTVIRGGKMRIRAREIHLNRGKGRRGGDRATAKNDVEITILRNRRRSKRWPPTPSFAAPSSPRRAPITSFHCRPSPGG